MRDHAPFTMADLEEIDSRFYSPAARVVAMEDVHDGERAPNMIGLRHDCDAGHSLATAVQMARWEQERGYRSTYFILHTAPYWRYPDFGDMLYEIAGCGHEIGIHTNALAQSLRTGEDPDLILDRAVSRLRDLGFRVRGAVGHGDPICLREREEDESPFANDEHFAECVRPAHGAEDRMLWRGDVSRKLAKRSLADFGLEYEALFLGLPWHFRFADSGGRWLDPGFDKTAERFALQAHVTRLPRKTDDPRQLHLLIHPDWWNRAFAPARLAA